MFFLRFMMTGVLMVGVAGLAGCQADGEQTSELAPPGRAHVRPGRSLVIFSPPLRQRLAALPPRAPVPWWAGRYDAVPSVVAGRRSATYSRSITITRDSQDIAHGRVFDDYDSTTYRREVTEGVR